MSNWQAVGSVLLVAVVIVGGVFLMCMGLEVLLEVPFLLTFGWVRYLARVVPRLNPDPAAVATGVACLLGITLGGHAFLRWLYAATGPQEQRRRWPWKWTLKLVGLVVLMFVSGIAVTGIAHQTGWLIRSPEPLFESSFRGFVDRNNSSNNLKQIGLAAHAYNDVNHHLPQSTFDSLGRPQHSWQTAILPFMEEAALYQRIDQSKPWTHPDNAKPMGAVVHQFVNPNFPPDRVNWYGVSHYAGNVHIVLTDTPKTMLSFPQGTSNVILAGEVASNFRPWGDPLNARDPRLGTNHPHGFAGPNRPPQFLMLDGTVRTFDAKELAELLQKIPE
jgi:hypothetical protein